MVGLRGRGEIFVQVRGFCKRGRGRFLNRLEDWGGEISKQFRGFCKRGRGRFLNRLEDCVKGGGGDF